MKIAPEMDLDELLDALLGFATTEEAAALRDLLVRHLDGQYLQDIPQSVLAALTNEAMARMGGGGG